MQLFIKNFLDQEQTFSNKDLNDIMKIVKSLEDSGLLIKGVSGTVGNELKEQKGEFLSMLATSLLGNMFSGKGVIRASKGTITAGTDF